MRRLRVSRGGSTGLWRVRSSLHSGWAGDAIDWRLRRRRRLHRLHRGVYAVGHLALTRNGQFSAAVLACGDGAALSHFSAAVLWGILEGRGQAIHVTAPGHKRCPGLVVHWSPLEGERVRREGIADFEEEFLAFCDSRGLRRPEVNDPVKDADLQIAGWRMMRIPSERLSTDRDGVERQLRALLKRAPAAPVAQRPR